MPDKRLQKALQLGNVHRAAYYSYFYSAYKIEIFTKFLFMMEAATPNVTTWR